NVTRGAGSGSSCLAALSKAVAITLLTLSASLFYMAYLVQMTAVVTICPLRFINFYCILSCQHWEIGDVKLRTQTCHNYTCTNYDQNTFDKHVTTTLIPSTTLS
ncbi:hypothetical protein GQX74_009353, partial [Glossina fuscipes]